MKRLLTIFITILFFLVQISIFGQKPDLNELKPQLKNGHIQTIAQIIQEQRVTGILTQDWIGDDSWGDASRMLFSYNEAGLMVQVLGEYFEDGNWITEFKTTMEYNNNLITKEVMLFYVGEEIHFTSMMYEYSYNGSKINEIIRSSWDLGDWELDSKDVYEYTGELVTRITGYSPIGLDPWNLSDESIISYDNQNREIEYLSKLYEGDSFVNEELTTTEYYKNELVSIILSKSWDPDTEVWSEDNFTLMEYTYDTNDNLINDMTTFSYGVMGISILMKLQTINQYDGNNYLVESIDYFWEESIGFSEQNKSVYTNHSNGNINYIIDYIPYGDDDWLETQKHIYDYEGAVSVKDETQLPVDFSLAQNYPNPFNPTTIIPYSINNTENVKLVIYDLLGNYITTLVDAIHTSGNYKVEFNATELASGTYIYSLVKGTQTISKKCLLLK